ncbi:MAG TPA: hypothetical protein VFB70_08065 [Pyrinomonadaceae bacterium]|nr:hypothetical protein [Pyrinomonadaceae bacterium]
MRRNLLRLATALLTFCLGVVVTVISSVKRTETPGTPTVAVTIQVPFTPVATDCYPGLALEIPAMDNEAFFPPKILAQDQAGNQFRNKWYSRHLTAMKEEPLYSPNDKWVESYRFLWLRTFHHPVAVHIWKCGSTRFISVKELDGAGGYEPGKLKLERKRELTRDEWREFMRHLEDSCYWQLPSRDDGGGFDGAQWIFEGVKGGRYHIVDRWTPQNGSYRELCLYVLKLSGLKLDASELY